MGCFLSKDKDKNNYFNSTEDNFIFQKRKNEIVKERDKKRNIL